MAMTADLQDDCKYAIFAMQIHPQFKFGGFDYGRATEAEGKPCRLDSRCGQSGSLLNP